MAAYARHMTERTFTSEDLEEGLAENAGAIIPH